MSKTLFKLTLLGFSTGLLEKCAQPMNTRAVPARMSNISSQGVPLPLQSKKIKEKPVSTQAQPAQVPQDNRSWLGKSYDKSITGDLINSLKKTVGLSYDKKKPGLSHHLTSDAPTAALEGALTVPKKIIKGVGGYLGEGVKEELESGLRKELDVKKGETIGSALKRLVGEMGTDVVGKGAKKLTEVAHNVGTEAKSNIMPYLMAMMIGQPLMGSVMGRFINPGQGVQGGQQPQMYYGPPRPQRPSVASRYHRGKYSD